MVLDQATPQLMQFLYCKHSLTSFYLRRVVDFTVALLITKKHLTLLIETSCGVD